MRAKSPELSRERETAILQAAQKRFAQFGLRKVTMDEIAADISMSKAALYYYFPTKEELFRRVIQREQLAFLERLAHSLAEEPVPGEKLRLWARQRLSFFRELLNLSALGRSSWQEMSPLFGDLFQDFARAEQRLLAEILATGQAQGAFIAPDPEQGAALIHHVFHGIRLRFLKQLELPREADYAELEREAEQLMQLLLDGLRPRTDAPSQVGQGARTPSTDRS